MHTLIQKAINEINTLTFRKISIIEWLNGVSLNLNGLIEWRLKWFFFPSHISNGLKIVGKREGEQKRRIVEIKCHPLFESHESNVGVRYDCEINLGFGAIM